ncbi:MAG: coenzyme F420-0:L-glutamate ligase [Chloroflexi bacterium]|nr:coenzyme F420-0:L-glutamate ligase [Chloroflexota bacterium]MCI0791223.1 coenzyme F420-0:L-glutamate ligase [Chloroflexota bacterium]
MNVFPRIEIIGVTGLPEINKGDNLSEMIVGAAQRQGTPLVNGDILVVTQKVVSKAEGRLVELKDVTPSPFARQLAEDSGKDARLVELVLRESRSIVRMDLDRGIMITETKHGFVCANAGIDSSNVPGDDVVCLLPVDPDKSAQGIRKAIAGLTGGAQIGVVISDTFGRAWREGHSNFAIGVDGVEPMKDYRGTLDANGRMLKVTTIAVADELAAAAEMVTAKAINVPVAIVRGYEHGTDSPNGIKPMIRDRSRDLFR